MAKAAADEWKLGADLLGALAMAAHERDRNAITIRYYDRELVGLTMANSGPEHAADARVFRHLRQLGFVCGLLRDNHDERVVIVTRDARYTGSSPEGKRLLSLLQGGYGLKAATVLSSAKVLASGREAITAEISVVEAVLPLSSASRKRSFAKHLANLRDRLEQYDRDEKPILKQIWDEDLRPRLQLYLSAIHVSEYSSDWGKGQRDRAADELIERCISQGISKFRARKIAAHLIPQTTGGKLLSSATVRKESGDE